MTITTSNVTIMTSDMDVTIAFYTSIGFIVKNRWGNHYTQLEAPGITIGLHPKEQTAPQGSGSVSIGFTTDDFEATHQLLNTLSVKNELREEEGGKFIHFNDPDGTSLYFIQPKW